jgi:hypothetical protein
MSSGPTIRDGVVIEGIRQNPTGHGVRGVRQGKAPTHIHADWRGAQVIAISRAT